MVADCSTNAESGAKFEQPLHLHTGRKHLRVGAMNYSRQIAPRNVQYTRDLAPVSDTFEGSTFVETSCLTAEVAVGHSLPAARSSKGFWGQTHKPCPLIGAHINELVMAQPHMC